MAEVGTYAEAIQRALGVALVLGAPAVGAALAVRGVVAAIRHGVGLRGVRGRLLAGAAALVVFVLCAPWAIQSLSDLMAEALTISRDGP